MGSNVTDEFGGTVVQSHVEHLWPANRASLVIANTAVSLGRGPQWAKSLRSMIVTRDEPIVVATYRYLPFLITNVVWLDETPGQRLGFQRGRWHAVHASFVAHGWPVVVRKHSWLTLLRDARRALSKRAR